MADIKQRISLDGADDVATKLKRIGDTGSDAFKKLKQYSGEAGSGLARHAEGLGEHAEGLGGSREAGEALRETLHTLHPVLEQAGIELGNLGAYARLAGAGLVPLGAALAGSVLVGLAKLGEETQKSKARLKSLGDDDGFDRLAERAKKAGVGVESLQGRYEKYLATTQQARARSSQVTYAPGYKPGEAEGSGSGVTVINGGRSQTPASLEAFGKFDTALLNEIRTDVKSAEAAGQILDEFESKLQESGVTGDLLRSLQSKSPSAANFLSQSIGDRLRRGFSNPSEAAEYLDRHANSGIPAGLTAEQQQHYIASHPSYSGIGVADLINEVAKREPESDKDASAARGVTEAFEGLEAASKRLAEELAGDRGITQAIDTLTHLIDAAAEHTDQFLHPRDYVPGGPKFIGPVSPEEQAHYNRPDILDVGKALFTGQADDRFKDSNAIAVAKSLYNGPQGLQKTPAEGLQDMIDAARQPGAIYQQQQPFIDETNRGVFRDTNPSYNWPVAPEQPQPQQQSQDTTQGGVNVAAAIDASGEKQSSVFERVGAAIVSAITALAQGANPEHLKLEGTDAGASLGIRGATGGTITSGGVIPMLATGGGHLSGPGGPTDDKIPLWGSNGEFMTREKSTRFVGQPFMHWINSLGDGGADDQLFKQIFGGAHRHADGGPVLGSPLGLGQHQIAYDETTGGAIIDGLLHYPGDPILDDPVVKQAIARSKAAANGGSSGKKHKSDFTGRFGHDDDTDTYVADGGLIGHFAGGGLVGMMQHLASGGPALDLADHLDAPGSRPSLDLTSKLSGGGSPWDGLPHLGSMDLRSDHGDARIVGRQDVLREISRSANARALVRTGQSPSWRT